MFSTTGSYVDKTWYAPHLEFINMLICIWFSYQGYLIQCVNPVKLNNILQGLKGFQKETNQLIKNGLESNFLSTYDWGLLNKEILNS